MTEPRNDSRGVPIDLEDSIAAAWRTNSRATAFLIECLPSELWEAKVPEVPTRSIRSIAAHLHNSRCSWTRTLGAEHGIRAPTPVDPRTATQRRVLEALPHSAAGIGAVLELGLRNGGRIPGSRAYVWRNLPLDVGHVLSYFTAHEGHHRGQIVMVARQLHQRLPNAVTGGLWQWRKRSLEADASR